MLDHVFTDAISALRDAFEAAFLERQAFDEHFQVDVLLGDLSWETTLRAARRGPAAAGRRPRHLRLAELEPDRVPPLVRRRGARSAAGDRDGDRVPGAAPGRPARPVGRAAGDARDQPADRQRAAGARRADGRDRSPRRALDGEPEYAIEVTYEGLYELAEETLADGASTLLDEHFGALGGWIASTLVRLGDLKLGFRPADDASL